MNVTLIEVPYDSGRRGERMGRGPGRLLELGAAERARAAAGGSVDTAQVACSLAFPTEATCAFDLAAQLSVQVQQARSRGALPLVLAGNCMSSVGSVAGLADVRRLGVVWLDAHGDLNTPDTSPEGFLDGMAAAAVTGRCWQGPAAHVPGYRPVPDTRLLHVGARALDPAETALFAAGSIARIDGATFAEQGAAALAGPLERLAAEVDAVYLHLDLDVHDADAIRVNPYAEPGGPGPAQVREAVAAVACRVPIAVAALTAYAPEYDVDGTAGAAALDLLESVAAAAAGR